MKSVWQSGQKLWHAKVPNPNPNPNQNLANRKKSQNRLKFVNKTKFKTKKTNNVTSAIKKVIKKNKSFFIFIITFDKLVSLVWFFRAVFSLMIATSSQNLRSRTWTMRLLQAKKSSKTKFFLFLTPRVEEFFSQAPR